MMARRGATGATSATNVGSGAGAAVDATGTAGTIPSASSSPAGESIGGTISGAGTAGATAATGAVPSAAPVTNAPPTASARQAGYNPNVIIPRAQMSEAQKAAADKHHARAAAERDRIVDAYLAGAIAQETQDTEGPPAPAAQPQQSTQPAVFDEPAGANGGT